MYLILINNMKLHGITYCHLRRILSTSSSKDLGSDPSILMLVRVFLLTLADLNLIDVSIYEFIRTEKITL